MARPFGLGKSRNVDDTQIRDQFQEHSRGDLGIRKCAMAIFNLNAAPSSDRLQRPVGQFRIQRLGQLLHVQKSGRRPEHSVSGMLRFQNRKVKMKRVSDEQTRSGPFRKGTERRSESGCIGYIRISDAVHSERGIGYRHARIHKLPEFIFVQDASGRNPNGRQLDDPIFARTETRCLGVEDDGGDRPEGKAFFAESQRLETHLMLLGVSMTSLMRKLRSIRPDNRFIDPLNYRRPATAMVRAMSIQP